MSRNNFPTSPPRGYPRRVSSDESPQVIRLPGPGGGRSSGSFFSLPGKLKLMKLPRLSPLLPAMILLASCVPKERRPEPQPAPAPPAAQARPLTAALLGVSAGPALAALDETSAGRALEAFRISCPALLRRTDASGLTRPEDWQSPCAAATAGAIASPAAFFADRFETIQVGDGTAFVTGYYEPEIAGSRTMQPGYEVPIYRKPPDLVEVDAATAEAAGTPRRGRLENGVMVPYYERSEIEAG